MAFFWEKMTFSPKFGHNLKKKKRYARFMSEHGVY